MQTKEPNLNTGSKLMGLTIGAIVLAIALLFAWSLLPEQTWLVAALLVLFIADIGVLLYQNQKALKTRAVAFGINSVVTAILVVAIVGVVNFLAYRYPAKLDLTKNKVHTLSDQTRKIIKDLKKPVKAVFFSRAADREKMRTILDNLKSNNPDKLEIEYIDPVKEPTRTKQAGIKRDGTLQLHYGEKDSKVEDPNEEKITNAIIKLTKDKSPTVCSIMGHGEKSFASTEADGYDAMKKALDQQFYQQKDVNLLQETKIPDGCDVVAILGPTKSYFDKEVQAIKAFFEAGGRGIIAIDINVQGGEFAPELVNWLSSWYVKPELGLIVDPTSKLLGQDAAVPIVQTFSKESPITKDFHEIALFPMARPLEIMKDAPPSLNIQWLAKTTANSFGEMDLKELRTGAVKYDEGIDKKGPLTLAVSISGKQKDSKAPRDTRMVVIGTSNFGTNNFSRFALNLDFFMNSVSWLAEDENMISIRAKEEGPGKVELSEKVGSLVRLLTVILMPLLIALSGVGIWIMRKKL